MAFQDGMHGHRKAACLCVPSWKRNAIGNDYQSCQYRSFQFRDRRMPDKINPAIE
jgi:hypothetical protein